MSELRGAGAPAQLPDSHLAAPHTVWFFLRKSDFQGSMRGIGCLETGQLTGFLCMFPFSTAGFHYGEVMGDVFLIYSVIINSSPTFEAKIYCDRNRNPIRASSSCCGTGSGCLNEALCKTCRRTSVCQSPWGEAVHQTRGGSAPSLPPGCAGARPLGPRFWSDIKDNFFFSSPQLAFQLVKAGFLKLRRRKVPEHSLCTHEERSCVQTAADCFKPLAAGAGWRLLWKASSAETDAVEIPFS